MSLESSDGAAQFFSWDNLHPLPSTACDVPRTTMFWVRAFLNMSKTLSISNNGPRAMNSPLALSIFSGVFLFLRTRFDAHEACGKKDYSGMDLTDRSAQAVQVVVQLHALVRHLA